MKTRTLFFALLAILLVSFIACSDDDDNKNKVEPTNERNDDLSRFSASLMREVFDDNGEVVERIPTVGQALYTATPTEYYICVEDLAEAKKSFMELVDDGIERVEVADNITLNLKDTKGLPQGNVYFSALAENENGHLAQVTFDPENTFPEVTKIIYVQSASWPVKGFQATSPFKFLKVANVKDGYHGNPRGICIREWTVKGHGIIIIPLKQEAGYYNFESNCKDKTLHSIAKYIKDNKIADQVDAALKSIDLGKLDEYYWSYNKYEHGLWNNIYTVNLKTNDSIRHTEWGVGTSLNKGKNFLGYYFDSSGKCW